jgi:hypothetical protein
MSEASEIAKKLGSLGGKSTLKRHGKEHYRKLAENMNKKLGRTGKKSTQALKKSSLNMPYKP